MGKAGKTTEGRSRVRDKADDKSKKPPALPTADDDFEDGDMATPKVDRYGDDDEPL
ncbi:hypothetical protein [Bradyrhizobium genosp. P]|uniref:hypothetical protein n=1 Tax=Bradyrhizobium genosp. P TaxID=83641 RepID=UPI003CF63B92